jgi:phenylalanyl-tRNA synthetase alpha chain
LQDMGGVVVPYAGKIIFSRNSFSYILSQMDTSVPTNPPGHYHPLTLAIAEAGAIFADLGFEIAEGPEIETDYYNFEAMNMPANHPAREMWDTFWIKPKEKNLVLRTHTSPMQARYMETHEPPLRVIVPGKTFRYEATDATHEAQFHQLEGLMVDRDVSLATLKGTLTAFLQRFFGTEVTIRFRPSYFPFVEPGVEVDMSCFKCKGEGCSTCKGSGWIEILGAGMVHPKVLERVGINPRVFRGFAFGCGIDRLVMLKYGVPDVRLLYTGDLRLVTQF